MERASRERRGDEFTSAEKGKSAESSERAPQSRASSLLGVQSSAGNAATIALLQRRGLEVGAADDPAEREADAVAAQVMNALHGRHGTGSETPEPPSGAVQRRTAGDLSNAPGHGAAGGPADPEVAGAIEAERGRGNSLPSSLRAPIESAMGADLGGVRIHADARADRLNRSLNAEAFTTGNDIFFRKGAYQPTTPAGTELLSHELAHVVQQSGGARRKLRRSLVRDRVYSDVEFSQGLPAQEEGSNLAGTVNNMIAALAALEKKHATLAREKESLADPKIGNQSFGMQMRGLDRVAKAYDEARGETKSLIPMVAQVETHLENQGKGLKSKVKGLFNKREKREKASILDRVSTLLLQLRRRDEQLFKEGEDNRVRQLSMKKQQIESEKEAKEQKLDAMDEARHGTFGMYKGRVNNANFGAGATGSVAQVDYKDEKGQDFKGVFKAEPEALPEAAYDMKITGTSEETPNLTLRAVAASRLNDLLGLKVIPRTEVAFHEQFGFGQVMALASGQSPRSDLKTKIEDADEEKIKKIEQLLEKEGVGAQVVRKKGLSGQVEAFIEDKVTYETDWDHPILKRQLCDLQLLDGLIRNIDRHVENYFIQVDQFGNPIGVLGIDNDLAFARDENDPTQVAFNAGHSAGLPPAINAATAEKFCSVTEAQVRKAVEGLLNALEINALVGRLKIIQAKLLEKANGEFVIKRIGNDLEGAKQWTELKDPHNAKGAYFARERKWQQGTMKNNGRLLKPNQALLYKEERLAKLIEKVEAKQGS